jgi:uncharacterized protein YjiS (DUF1127 family)
MLLLHIIHALQAWRRYRTCLRELSELSDHELADIGLTRSGISSVAWQTAREYVADVPTAKPSKS